jgi:hypothetical protein
VFTVKFTVATPPCELVSVTEHVPALTGVTTSVNVVPEPEGVPNETMALEPVPHVDVIAEIPVMAMLDVTVTVCAKVPPTPENVRDDGEALKTACGAATPVLNGGGFAPPP